MTSHLRKYTMTLKPVDNEYKGDKEFLLYNFHEFLKEVHGTSNYHQLEKEGTTDLHLHALIECPFIEDKKSISRKFKGFHLHTKVVPFKEYDNILDLWNKYIHKEQSDASRYELMYGCAFADSIINTLLWND